MTIHFPAILFREGAYLEILNSDIYLKMATKHTVKGNGYIGCRIFDSSDNCYFIEELIVLGKSRSLGIFSLFNPMLNIALKLKPEELSKDEMIEHIVSSIKFSSQFWEDFEDIEILLSKVHNEKSIASIISYLKSIREV